jgi:hypothetical protein
MISPSQLIQGVEWIWLVWLASLVVVLKMSRLALRHWRRPSWTVLTRGEEGVSYSLSYILVIPFYLLFACLVFETTWLLVAKVGTLYAAHAGARSAVVWSSAQPSDLAKPRIDQAVWTAMTPFATGYPSLTGLSGETLEQALEYEAAYQLFTAKSPDPYAHISSKGTKNGFTAMENRYLGTAAKTSWQKQIDNSRPDGDVTVTVTYRAPLHIPGAGRLLDPDGKPPYEYPITSSAKLPNEAPANDKRTLGIEYHSR